MTDLFFLILVIAVLQNELSLPTFYVNFYLYTYKTLLILNKQIAWKLVWIVGVEGGTEELIHVGVWMPHGLLLIVCL